MTDGDDADFSIVMPEVEDIETFCRQIVEVRRQNPAFGP
jgi:hypothetical protein